MRIPALLLIALLTACSGGGGSPRTIVAATSTPTMGNAQSGKTASAKVSIFIPKGAMTKNARTRSFVSAATEGIVVSDFTDPMSVNPTPLQTTGVDLTSSSYCSAPQNDGLRKRSATGGTSDATGLTCTFTIPVAIGKVDFTFTTYDAPPSATGVPAAGSKALGTAELTTTIVANQINALNVALDGIPASVHIEAAPGDGSAYFSGNVVNASYPVQVLDADGQTILTGNTVSNGAQAQSDAFSPPVVLTVTEPSNGGNHTTLSVNGGAGASSVTLSDTADASSVTLLYDGKAPAPYHAVVTATLQSSTTPVGSGTFLPIYIEGSGDGFSIGADGTPVFALSNAYDPIRFALSEDSSTPNFYVSVGSNEQINGPCSVGSVEETPTTGGNGTVFTVESGKFPDTGCQLQIEDTNAFVGLPVPGKAIATTLYVAIPGSNEIDAIGVPIGMGHADAAITGTHLVSPTGVAHGRFTQLYATTTSASDSADAFTLAAPAATAATETNQFSGGSFSAMTIDNLSNDPVLSNATTQAQYEFAAINFAAAMQPDTTVLESGSGTAVTTSITEDSFTFIYEALAGSAQIVEYPYQAESRGLDAPPETTFAIPSPAKGIVCDLAGHLFVADGSGTITEYTIGSTLTAANTFLDATVSFTGVAVDGAGNVFGVGTKSGAGFVEEFVANGTQRYSETLPGVPGQVTM